ncbi:LytR/AlgR family response regulator transcription factor [Belliella marina]|uniref:LytR/AlgR family response regulator transcription factor n=1 Tax=Belliella marina TaxID=1644146 RepID=A0ABW4VIW0_9BACT
MKIRCIIVEDERVAREGLQSYIEQYDFLELAGSFSNATDALQFLKEQDVSLMFLDIELPGIKGIEMARLLDGFLPLIIFTTAYAQYALEGYRVNAIDYLVKPIFPEDFHRSIQKARNYFGLIEINSFSETSSGLIIKSEGEWLRIEPAEIMFLKSMQNYVLIHFANFKPKMVLQPLREVYALLPSFFTQAHRSYVVNINLIEKIGDNCLTIGEFTIPLSRSRKKEATELFLNRNK